MRFDSARETLMTAPRWYVARGEQVLGPFELSELRQMVADRVLGRADQVCPEGESEWVPAATVPGLFTGPPPLPDRAAVPEGNPQQAAAGEPEAPAKAWRPVAAHGGRVGRWSVAGRRGSVWRSWRCSSRRTSPRCSRTVTSGSGDCASVFSWARAGTGSGTRSVP